MVFLNQGIGLDPGSAGSSPSRYEVKYIVHPRILTSIRRLIREFAQPDPFAARTPDHCYTVCSLYLDTPELKFFHQVQDGEKNRFKLRVRHYPDSPETPVFFEVKNKINNIIHKYRSPATREKAVRLLSGIGPGQATADSDPTLGQFINRMELTGARPVIRIRYRREPYESIHQDPVRLTIDTQVEYSPTPEPLLSHQEGEWNPIPVAGAIIEIKFTDRFPSWVSDLVRTFELRRRPVPKYALSVKAMLENWDRIGFELPDAKTGTGY